tara:strand:- start:3544 stop:5370 length:1827 start_codon:yes stop_codon:yes gene_type:complete
MIFVTIKRFIVIYKYAIQSIYFFKDEETLKELNTDFLADNEKLKREQNQLLQAQPGFKDLQLFLGMTSPGILLFDKVSDIDKSEIKRSYENWKNKREARLRRNRAYQSYINFLLRICNFIDNSYDISDKIIEEADAESGKFKARLDSQMISITRTDDFKKVIALISSHYRNINKNTGYIFACKISIDSRTFKILQLMHMSVKNNHDEIKETLAKNYTIQSKFFSLSSDFSLADFINDFTKDMANFSYDGKLTESKTISNVLLNITKNNLLITEDSSEDISIEGEEQTEEDKAAEESLMQSLQKEAGFSPKRSAAVSNLIYSIMRYELSSLVFKNILERMYCFTKIKKDHYGDLSVKAKIEETTSAEFSSEVNKVNKEVKEINKKIELFNKYFNRKISFLSEEKAEEAKKRYVDGASKINSELDKTEKNALTKFKDKEDSEKIASSIRFANSLEILAEIIKQGAVIKLLETNKSSISSFMNVYEEIKNTDVGFITKLKNPKSIIEKSKEALEKNNIEFNVSVLDNIKTYSENVQSSYNKLLNITEEFNNLKSKEEELNSKIKENLANIPEIAEELNNTNDDQNQDQNAKKNQSQSIYTEITYVNQESEK